MTDKDFQDTLRLCLSGLDLHDEGQWAMATGENLGALVAAGQVEGTQGHLDSSTLPCKLWCGKHRLSGEPIVEVRIPVRSMKESLKICHATQAKRNQ